MGLYFIYRYYACVLRSLWKDERTSTVDKRGITPPPSLPRLIAGDSGWDEAHGYNRLLVSWFMQIALCIYTIDTRPHFCHDL